MGLVLAVDGVVLAVVDVGGVPAVVVAPHHLRADALGGVAEVGAEPRVLDAAEAGPALAVLVLGAAVEAGGAPVHAVTHVQQPHTPPRRRAQVPAARASKEGS